jgi:hypothetical protein
VSDGVAATLAQLKVINGSTTATITVNTQTASANYSALAGDLELAFSGITSLTGSITVTNEATIAQANIILAATEGNVSLNLPDNYTTGGTLTGLRTGDSVDVDYSNRVSGFGLGSAPNAAQVTGASDWHFDQGTGLFTWWDTDQRARNSITLDGVGTINISTDGFTVSTTGTGISYNVTTTDGVDTIVINSGNADYPIVSGFSWGTDKIDLTLVETVANANGDAAAVTNGVNSGNVAIATLPSPVSRIPYAATEELFIADRDLTGVTKNSTNAEIISEGLTQIGLNGTNAGVPLSTGEGALIMMDNGIDSFLFLILENGITSEIGAGELTLIAIFEGLGADNAASSDFI